MRDPTGRCGVHADSGATGACMNTGGHQRPLAQQARPEGRRGLAPREPETGAREREREREDLVSARVAARREKIPRIGPTDPCCMRPLPFACFLASTPSEQPIPNHEPRSRGSRRYEGRSSSARGTSMFAGISSSSCFRSAARADPVGSWIDMSLEILRSAWDGLEAERRRSRDRAQRDYLHRRGTSAA